MNCLILFVAVLSLLMIRCTPVQTSQRSIVEDYACITGTTPACINIIKDAADITLMQGKYRGSTSRLHVSTCEYYCLGPIVYCYYILSRDVPDMIYPISPDI